MNKLAGETAGQPGGLSEYVCCSDATEMCKQLYDHKDKRGKKTTTKKTGIESHRNVFKSQRKQITNYCDK